MSDGITDAGRGYNEHMFRKPAAPTALGEVIATWLDALLGEDYVCSEGHRARLSCPFCRQIVVERLRPKGAGATPWRSAAMLDEQRATLAVTEAEQVTAIEESVRAALRAALRARREGSET